jgi:UDP:flavonoid glycosyltransferase YjiC (YdhE family)
VPRAWGLAREDVFAIEATGLPFLDLLASTDLLLTKTGYGSIVEAACAGVPVLYVRRPDWPEEPYLGPWVEAEGLARGIDRTALEGAAFTEAVRDLLGAPRPRPVEPTGVEEAVDVLAGFLTRD